MKPSLFCTLFIALLLAGCANPGRAYVSNHPELTPDQRAIVTSGNIPEGVAVAGMSKSAIRAAMRSDPTQFTKIDEVDAWVYTREKGTGDFTNDPGGVASDQSPGAPRVSSVLTGPEQMVQEHITVFFQGDVATRAEITKEKIAPADSGALSAPR